MPEVIVLYVKQRLLRIELAIAPSFIIPTPVADLDTDGEEDCKQDNPSKNDSDYLRRLLYGSALLVHMIIDLNQVSLNQVI